MRATHIAAMEENPAHKSKLRDRPQYQWAMLCLGWVLVLASPLIGALPGPGFLIVFPIGLAVILKHSRWAKKQYVRLTRANPEYGDWINWALGRSRLAGKPDFPPIKRDIMHIFRRDDIGKPMA